MRVSKESLVGHLKSAKHDWGAEIASGAIIQNCSYLRVGPYREGRIEDHMLNRYIDTKLCVSGISTAEFEKAVNDAGLEFFDRVQGDSDGVWYTWYRIQQKSS